MKKKILIISPVSTHPQSAGHRTRIYYLAENLKKSGHSVHFAYLKGRFRAGEDDMVSMRKYWGKRLAVFPYKNFQPPRNKKGLPSGPWNPDRWFDHSLKINLEKLAKKLRPDAVIAEYAAVSKALDSFGQNTLKIIDTLDIYTNRDRQLLKHGIPLSGWYSLNKQQEKKALQRAAVILAIQENDKRFFSKLTGKKVVTVGHWFPIHPPVLKKSSGNKILFVGAGGQVSKKSVGFFISEIFPFILKRIPDAKLLIAGNVCSLLKDPPRNCFKLGYVKNLEKLHADADVVINSEIFATGASTKSGMALAYAKPLVTTSAGARGMEKASGKAFLAADHPAAFAKHILRLLTDSRFARNLSLRAHQFAEQSNAESFKALANLFR